MKQGREQGVLGARSCILLYIRWSLRRPAAICQGFAVGYALSTLAFDPVQRITSFGLTATSTGSADAKHNAQLKLF